MSATNGLPSREASRFIQHRLDRPLTSKVFQAELASRARAGA